MFLEKKPSILLYQAGLLLAVGWCQRGLAATEPDAKLERDDERSVPPNDGRACAWCMFGALIKAMNVEDFSARELHLAEVYLESVLSEYELSTKTEPGELIETVNDSPIWNQVKAVRAFEAACKLALENGE
jgi:hypothetical protein